MQFARHLFHRVAKHVSHPRNLISSKVSMYVVAVLALFFAYQTAQVVIKRHQTENDIKTFEKQVIELQGTQGRLQELNRFLETDFFAEKEARLKMGMQLPGETVVVLSGSEKVSVTDSQDTSTMPPSSTGNVMTESSRNTDISQQNDRTQKQKSNPSKWWDYFFAQDNK